MKALSWHLVMAGAIIFFGFMLLAVFVMVTQYKNDSQYQQPASEGKLHFRRPRATRIFGALVSLGFLGGVPAFAGVRLDPKTIGTATGSIAGDICLTSVFFLLVSFGFSFLAGPDELFIDLSARTYCRKWGWLLFPKSASGSTSEIIGVCVQDLGTVANPSFHVCLRWRGNKGLSLVGLYESRAEAETAASKLKQLLGPQCIKLPFWM